MKEDTLHRAYTLKIQEKDSLNMHACQNTGYRIYFTRYTHQNKVYRIKYTVNTHIYVRYRIQDTLQHA